MKSDTYLKLQGVEISNAFIRNRADYLSEVGSCLAWSTEDRVLSYIIYRNLNNGGVILYFAYTQKELRKTGLLTKLLENLELSVHNELRVSYLGPKNEFLQSLNINYTKYGV